MKVLFIANARRKGGLSGSDGIYLAFEKHWPDTVRVWQMMDIDFKPFWLCYVYRILLGCFIALIEPQRYDLVYSCSDFWMDSLPAWIMKMKGNKWVAGFFLFAPKDNKIYFQTQKLAYWLINKYADMVIVTNPTMFEGFKRKKKTWINGGIDLALCGISEEPKVYDAVFCGRIHPTKGIDELMDIWSMVRYFKNNARLAIIGDGDLTLDYIRSRIWRDNHGIDLLGYMGDERFEIFKKSKVVLYPTPLKYDHFSIAPVEAMACGCPMVCFENPSVLNFMPIGTLMARSKSEFSYLIMALLQGERRSIMNDNAEKFAKKFSWPLQTNRVREDILKCVF